MVASLTTTTITNHSLTGPTHNTNWCLKSSPQRPADLARLEDYTDPNWLCRHASYDPQSPLTANSNIKFFIPSHI
ncbi:hypothetical protein BDV96DRAFT_574889 [Lophiotrema nucula]|uniref:Uncharacterized protein n=1 Tax=Lophiotrema nucula TaxID=690887 RepID=A0A6A5ZC14_9PLEO|nr:hypothetical protein BDV96DRAFT_574889 [Lophiotrema nucula]